MQRHPEEATLHLRTRETEVGCKLGFLRHPPVDQKPKREGPVMNKESTLRNKMSKMMLTTAKTPQLCRQ